VIRYKQFFPHIRLFANTIPWWSFLSSRDDDLYFGSLPFFSHLYRIDTAYTKQIDLIQEIDDPLTIMRASTATKIRQAKKKIVIKPYHDVDLFVTRYNAFANEKGLAAISRMLLEKIPDEHKLICAAYIEEQQEACAFMCYFFDDERARIVYACTYTQMPEYKNKVSFATLYLYYYGIEYFKSQGKHVYDLGGYPPDTTCPKMLGVNAFKDQFNGVLVKSYRIRSYWVYWLTKSVSFLKRQLR
jgi:lipid II:glycine glycyltransferase (peptidoglycan interpeptide bridge formation enzyme)